MESRIVIIQLLMISSFEIETSASISENAYKLLTKRSIKFHQKKYEISQTLPEIDPVRKLGYESEGWITNRYNVIGNITNLPSANELESLYVYNL